jgi:hypothetical protein
VLKKSSEDFPCPSIPAAREPIFVVIPFDLLRKRRLVVKDVDVGNVRERWAGGRKGGLPLLPSLRVVMHTSFQRGRHGKTDGKKKVMGKERKSKEERFVEKSGDL